MIVKNSHLLIVALVSLFLCPAMASAEEGNVAAQLNAELPSPPLFRASDVKRVSMGGDVYVDRLTGLAAYAHLQNLRSKHPEAFESASRSLREKGFRPTGDVYVERTVRLASSEGRGSRGALGFAQDHSESNSEGEILFWSWSDGDDNTWEGQIYVEIYSNGDASTWEGQIDASNEDHEWIYHQQTWEKPREEYQDVGLRPQLQRNPPTQGKMTAVPAILSRETQSYRGQYALAGWLEWSKCWRQNVVAGCTGAAVGCIATNGAWPACWGATCVGVEVASAIACY